MKTLISIVVLVGVIVAVGLWQFAGDGAPAVAEAAAPAAVAPAATTPVPAQTSGEVVANAAPPGDVTRLISEANGADAKKRVEAIAALAQVPRDQALPALRQILTSGDAHVDKPAALNSLRELALGQGDKDGKVREAIREVLYHDDGQNPQLATDAQDALDVVEESEMK